MLKNWLKGLVFRVFKTDRIPSLYWGQIFNSTIVGSSWYKNQGISPGRWAVGYSFLYVLYRTLNDVQPRSILELGLGQSTKLTTQYVEANQVNHIVVEHDPTWKKFFEQGCSYLSEKTKIFVSPLKEIKSMGDRYFEYRDFKNIVTGRKYDLLLIDGPWGGDGRLSRRDILPLMPQMLAKDFVLIFDDCGRQGEQKTVADVEAILRSNNIAYTKGIYDDGGMKYVVVLASESWKFLCTL